MYWKSTHYKEFSILDLMDPVQCLLYGKFRALTFENAGITDLDKAVNSTIVDSDCSANGEPCGKSGVAPHLVSARFHRRSSWLGMGQASPWAEHDAGEVLSYRVEQLTHLRNWILEHTKGILEELTQVCVWVGVWVWVCGCVGVWVCGCVGVCV